MSTAQALGEVIHDVIVDFIKLKNPVTAAAVAAVIITLIPVTGISATAVAAVLGGFGLVASFVSKLLYKEVPAPTPSPTTTP